MPSVGYVIQEASRRGNVQIQGAKPLLDRNREALAALGIRRAEILLGDLRNGERVELPDGSVLDPSDPALISPPVRGHKLAIFGDTSRVSPQLMRAARGCDLLVHEGTNSLTTADRAAAGPGGQGVAPERGVRAKTISHGHSTARMAGEVARAIGARTLLVNHLSARYAAGVGGHRGMLEIAEAAAGGMAGQGDDGGRPQPHVERLRQLLASTAVPVSGTSEGDAKSTEGSGAVSADESRRWIEVVQPPTVPPSPWDAPHIGSLKDTPEHPLLPVARKGRVICA